MVSFPLDPIPSTLWILSRDDSPKVASCEVRFVPTGFELRVLRDSSHLWSQIFSCGEEALRMAEDKKGRMMRDGWTLKACVRKRLASWWM
jgi:hypothetical protein